MLVRLLTTFSAAAALTVAVAMNAGEALGGGTCHEGNGVTDARATTVTMSNNCFVATITRVHEGATITFVNEDDAAHTVTGANFSWGQTNVSKGDEPEDPYLAKGDRLEQTFDESGVYPYFCFLHPGMIGAVVVGDGEGAGAAAEGAVRPASLAISEQDARTSGNAAAASGAATDADNSSIVLPLVLVASGVFLLVGIVMFARTLAGRWASAG
jgi:plastocyanin